MKRVLVGFLVSLFPVMSAAAISPPDFLDGLYSYYRSENSTVIEDTIEIYTSGVKISPSVDSLLFMFYNGIRKYEPEEYVRFSRLAGESGNFRLKQIVEVIDEYDLGEYLARPEATPEYVDNIVILFFSSGDPAYLDTLYRFTEDYYREKSDRDKFTAGRSALMALKNLMDDSPSVAEHFAVTEILSGEVREYILANDSETIVREASDFYKAQVEKGVWQR